MVWWWRYLTNHQDLNVLTHLLSNVHFPKTSKSAVFDHCACLHSWDRRVHFNSSQKTPNSQGRVKSLYSTSKSKKCQFNDIAISLEHNSIEQKGHTWQLYTVTEQHLQTVMENAHQVHVSSFQVYLSTPGYVSCCSTECEFGSGTRRKTIKAIIRTLPTAFSSGILIYLYLVTS